MKYFHALSATVLTSFILSFSTPSPADATTNQLTANAEYYRQLAEQGDIKAQSQMGYLYYVGEGVPQDYAEAVNWYRKAATQGDKDAQYNLAVAYAFGEGVERDLTEAATWYRRAAEQGHVISQYSLGLSYVYGEGVPQDANEAARWFKLAAEQGYSRAQIHLGSMYHTGEGVKQDYAEAIKWYRMAADRGDATAQYNLGTLYRAGKGVEQDYAQAIRWFRLAADQGYAAAQNELASLQRVVTAPVATRPAPQAHPIPESEANVSTTPTTESLTQATKVEQPASIDAEVTQTEQTTVAQTTPEVFKSESQPIAKPLTSTNETTANKAQISIGTQVVTPSATEGSSGRLFGGLFNKMLKSEETDKVDLNLIQQETEPETVDGAEIVAMEPKPTETMETTEEPEQTSATSSDLTQEKTNEEETTVAATDETQKKEGFFSRLFGTSKDQPEAEVVDKGLAHIEDDESVIDAESEQESVAAEEVAVVDQSEPLLTAEIEAIEREEVEVMEPAADAADSEPGFFSKLFLRKETTANETEDIVKPEQRLALLNNTPTRTTAKAEKAEPLTHEPVAGEEFSIESGRTALSDGDYDEAARQFEPLAMGGDAEAQSHLASMYYIGKGIPQDYIQAFAWYRRAAEQGHMDSQYSVGNMYLLGEGVDQDNQLASEWYGKAAAQGHVSAQHNLENLQRLMAQSEEPTNESPINGAAPATQETDIPENVVTETKDETAIPDESIAAQDPEKKQGGLGGFFSKLFGKKDSSESEAVEIVDASAAEENITKATLAETSNDEPEETQAVKTYAMGEVQGAEPLGSVNEVAAEVTEIEPETIGTDNQNSVADAQADFSFFEEMFNAEDSTSEPAAVTKLQAAATETEMEAPVIAEATAESVESTDTIETETVAAEESVNNFETTEKEKPSFFARIFGNDKTEANEPNQTAADTDTTTELVTETVADDAEQASPEETSIEPAAETIAAGTDDEAEKIAAAKSLDSSEPAPSNAQEESSGFFRSLFDSKDEKPAANVKNATLLSSEEVEKEYITEYEEPKELAPPESQEVASIRPRAIQGNAEAQYQLGTLYYEGNSVKQDHTQAFLWYRRAAQQGYVTAQYKLGNMYLMGEGATQDDQRAMKWYEAAADQGHEAARHNFDNLQKLSAQRRLHEANKPTETNTPTKTQQFALGNPGSSQGSAPLTEEGELSSQEIAPTADDSSSDAEKSGGLWSSTKKVFGFGDDERSTPQREQTVSKVADEESQAEATPENTVTPAVEDADQLFEKGMAHAFGDGVPQDYDKAFGYFHEAASQGHPAAQYRLGVAYAYGEGVDRDEIKAAEWYQRAAEQGYIIAQRNLASMYMDGKGVSQDKVKAHAWYRVVADNGNVMDARRRDMLQQEMTNEQLLESKRIASELNKRLTNL